VGGRRNGTAGDRNDDCVVGESFEGSGRPRGPGKTTHLNTSHLLEQADRVPGWRRKRRHTQARDVDFLWKTGRTPRSAAGCNKPALLAREQAAEVVRNGEGGTCVACGRAIPKVGRGAIRGRPGVDRARVGDGGENFGIPREEDVSAGRGERPSRVERKRREGIREDWSLHSSSRGVDRSSPSSLTGSPKAAETQSGDRFLCRYAGTTQAGRTTRVRRSAKHTRW
jgi:hypothetical protein